MTTFRPGQGYPAPRTTEEALRAIKVPSGPAPGATARPDPSTEKRVVLIKPGDVLLIGGVRFNSAEQVDEAMRRFKELTGITPVVLFADDIQIDALTAEQIARLATQESA